VEEEEVTTNNAKISILSIPVAVIKAISTAVGVVAAVVAGNHLFIVLQYSILAGKLLQFIIIISVPL
jgi:hypothetical protein